MSNVDTTLRQLRVWPRWLGPTRLIVDRVPPGQLLRLVHVRFTRLTTVNVSVPLAWEHMAALARAMAGSRTIRHTTWTAVDDPAATLLADLISRAWHMQTLEIQPAQGFSVRGGRELFGACAWHPTCSITIHSAPDWMSADLARMIPRITAARRHVRRPCQALRAARGLVGLGLPCGVLVEITLAIVDPGDLARPAWLPRMVRLCVLAARRPMYRPASARALFDDIGFT